MITGTIKDYTITTLQNILGMLVIQKGTQTNEIKILNRRTIHTHMLDNLDIHTSNGLHIKNLETLWYFQDSPMRTRVTYTSSVHHGNIHTTITRLNKQTLWEILNHIV